jgi:outer membrane immunogenic protein
MRKAAFGFAVGATLIGTPAFAADMALKSETLAYSWTGCYVGMNGGYGWNTGSSSYHDPNPTGDPINFLPDPFGFPLSYIPTPSATRGSGGLVGGSGGCNFQSRQWVVGFEAYRLGEYFGNQQHLGKFRR